MGKIKVSALIAVFERMAREHWAYEWGAAREGCVDSPNGTKIGKLPKGCIVSLKDKFM